MNIWYNRRIFSSSSCRADRNERFLLWTVTSLVDPFSNNHIIMAPTDSEPSEAPATRITPFGIFARPTTFSKSAKQKRDAGTRRPMVPSKSSQKRPAPQVTILRASDDELSSATIPTSVAEKSDTAEVIEAERKSPEDPAPDVSFLQTPGPRSSVSQASGTTFKKSRAKTSQIHEYISTRGDSFVCNRCSKIYKSSGGTGAIARHLKKAHSIDPTASGIAGKKPRERSAIEAAILRGAETNLEAEEKRREELMAIDLNKNTLEYLYLQWTIPLDIPFGHVRNTEFRTFLEYVNPVANRMLPNSESTMKIHAESLLAEGKSGV